MESTAVYWVPVWNELCESMDLKLVNPYFIKQLPGRKSDVKDAQWIAECLLKNLIKGSFVPKPIVQDMRKLNRRIMDLNEDINYNSNKLDAALQRCGFRLSNYVSGTNSKSYQKVLQAIINGERDPEVLVKMVHGRTTNKHGKGTIKAAVMGSFSQTDITVFRQLKEMLDTINRQIDECQKELTDLCEKHFSGRIQTDSDYPRCQGTRRHSYNCGNRSGYEDVCHGSHARGMVRTQTSQRRQQRTLQKQKSDTWKQIPSPDSY